MNNMEIITRQNYLIIEEINLLLKEYGSIFRVTAKPFETKTNVSIIVGVPRFDVPNDPALYQKLLTLNYKDTDKRFSEVLVELNQTLNELLIMIKRNALEYTRNHIDETVKISYSNVNL